MMAVRYCVGTSGWHYEHWRERFYPRDLAKSAWLDHYSRSFTTVEVNNSFYRLPSEKAFLAWKEWSPAGSIFALKVNRFITHIKRLRDAAEAVANFMARARLLGEKMGPLLFQLPPQMKRDDDRLEEFLSVLPRDTENVFEFRNRTWLVDPVFDLLRRSGAGLCIYDMPDFTTPLVTTTGFAYVRFHGGEQLYGGCYSDDLLQEWARRITGFGVPRTYAYFNNDIEGFAVRNALTLRRLLEATGSR